MHSRLRLFLTLCVAIGALSGHAALQVVTPRSVPRTTLTAASTVYLPGAVDSNSPVMWDLEDGRRTMFVMTSSDGVPRIASGPSVDRMSVASDVAMTPHPGYGVWMEAVVFDDVETWYGFYHNEWPALRCGREDRMVSRIGAARSTDRGRTWQDLGAVIQSPQSATACWSQNRYIIGGVGDLSVMLDEDKQYLYFFYSQYHNQAQAQGVAVARMQWADRDRPAGRLELWREGIWEPDAGRREFQQTIPGSMRRRLEWTYPAGTPLVAPTYAWHDADERVGRHRRGLVQLLAVAVDGLLGALLDAELFRDVGDDALHDFVGMRRAIAFFVAIPASAGLLPLASHLDEAIRHARR